jgi:glycosyltransferase involved in cell wall biosynthesis
MKKISIITVVKNGMPYLADAIKSFYMQNYNNKELIIIYSKSNDDTEKYLNNLLIKKNIKIFKDNNTGNKFDAINIGIKKSSGKIIGLLHSDDIFFSSNTLKKISKYFNNPKTDGVYGGVYFTKKNNLSKVIRIWKPEKINKKNLKYGWMLAHTSLFLKKNIFNKIGLYTNKYKISGDYEFILRLFLNKNSNIFNTNLYHMIMRYGGESTRIKDLYLKLIEDYKIARKYNLNYLSIFIKVLSKIKQLLNRKTINNKYINEFILHR